MKLDPLKSPKVKALAEKIKKHTIEVDAINSAIEKATNELHKEINQSGLIEIEIKNKHGELSTIEALNDMGRANDDQLKKMAILETEITKLSDHDLKPVMHLVKKTTGKIGSLKSLLSGEMEALESAKAAMPQAYQDYYIEESKGLLTDYVKQAKALVELVATIGALDELTDSNLLFPSSGFLLPVPRPAEFYKQVENLTPFYEGFGYVDNSFLQYQQTIKNHILKKKAEL